LNKYFWSINKISYLVKRNSDATWTIIKDEKPLANNAKCMIYSDILNHPDWNTADGYQKLPNY
jgi:hypothetical protein